MLLTEFQATWHHFRHVSLRNAPSQIWPDSSSLTMGLVSPAPCLGSLCLVRLYELTMIVIIAPRHIKSMSLVFCKPRVEKHLNNLYDLLARLLKLHDQRCGYRYLQRRSEEYPVCRYVRTDSQAIRRCLFRQLQWICKGFRSNDSSLSYKTQQIGQMDPWMYISLNTCTEKIQNIRPLPRFLNLPRWWQELSNILGILSIMDAAPHMARFKFPDTGLGLLPWKLHLQDVAWSFSYSDVQGWKWHFEGMLSWTQQ